MNILLISYDNGSHIPFFPINLFYLVGHLKRAGHRVGVWNQDIHHGPDEALLHILNQNEWDVVGLGMVAGYYQYRKMKSLSRVINASTRRPYFQYVLGGHGPAAEPEWFMRKMGATTVVVGDGEDGFDQIMQGRQGIIHAAPCNNDVAPMEAYEDFYVGIYDLIRWPTSTSTDRCMPILTSRGCKWACSFCYRMRPSYHMRAVDAIMDEIKYLHNSAGINHFQFADELLMASEARTEDICQAISELNFRIKWDCNGRLNYAKRPVLKLMKTCGCEYINYGIESLSQELLNQMKKGLTVNQIHQGVRETLEAGISPGLNFIWGFPGDTVQNLNDMVEFLLEYDPCHELRTIRPVTPYPGTALYRQAIDDGLLEGPEDFYEQKHLNSDLLTVNFMDIPTADAHKELYHANFKLCENYEIKKTQKRAGAMYDLYIKGNTSFRGFRPV